MGRHAEASGTPLDLRRTAQLTGLTGGVAWVVAFFLPDGGRLQGSVLWVGAVLLTVALFDLGLLLVRSDVLALRVFVALALPTLVWGVFGLVHGSAADPGLVDAVFGAIVGLVSAVRLGQHDGVPRATL
ncbi:MAG TPA: hypothetical protein VGK78_09350 [Nocardioides sp.]|uniref:hypothetical protein n=1 Tax=Nocardioides sp. TaxID=35761 RepID=UPI002F3F6A93